MVLLLTRRVWEHHPTPSRLRVCARLSVVACAAEAIRNHEVADSGRWRQPLSGISVWWRVVALPDGEQVALLALRWEAAGQVGVKLPGVTDQASLVALGTSYGVIDPSPPVPVKVQGGSVRIAVLLRSFAAPLLNTADDLTDDPHTDT